LVFIGWYKSRIFPRSDLIFVVKAAKMVVETEIFSTAPLIH